LSARATSSAALTIAVRRSEEGISTLADFVEFCGHTVPAVESRDHALELLETNFAPDVITFRSSSYQPRSSTLCHGR
jgi:hypothetical protein